MRRGHVPLMRIGRLDRPNHKAEVGHQLVAEGTLELLEQHRPQIAELVKPGGAFHGDHQPVVAEPQRPAVGGHQLAGHGRPLGLNLSLLEGVAEAGLLEPWGEDLPRFHQ